MPERKKHRNLSVLVSFNRPRTDDHHFVNLFAEAVPSSDLEIRFFSPRNILLRRIDVFSLHWPELMAKGSSRLKQVVKYVILMVLVLRIVVQRIPVVYTVHNEAPHEQIQSRWGRFFYATFTRLVTFRAYLNESLTNDYARGCVILHGAYPVTALPVPDDSINPPSVLSFGNVRPYKGVELVIETAAASSPAGVEFEIVGAGNDESYLSRLRSLGAPVPGLRMDFRYLDDAALLGHIHRSSAVILPYRNMYNSGAALLALSAGRPVIVPRSAANVALEKELGEDWVHIVEPDSSADDWALAVKETIDSRAQSPSRFANMERRGWNDIGDLYRRLFFRADRLSLSRPRAEVGRLIRNFVEGSDAFTRHSSFNALAARTESPSHHVAD